MKPTNILIVVFLVLMALGMWWSARRNQPVWLADFGLAFLFVYCLFVMGCASETPTNRTATPTELVYDGQP